MRTAPRRIQLRVKTARLAHSRHRPESKNDISTNRMMHHHEVEIICVIAGSDEELLPVPAALRIAFAVFVGATAYAM